MQNLPFFWSTKTLILDDDEMFLSELKEVLGNNHNYICFTDPIKAVEYLAKQDFCLDWYTNGSVTTEEGRGGYNINYNYIPSAILNNNRLNIASNVIVDYNMPTMSGIAFCKQIEQYRFLRKTLLTSSIESSEAINNLNCQIINSFIDKRDISKKGLLINHIKKQEEIFFATTGRLVTESLFIENNKHPFLSKEYSAIIRRILIDYKIEQYYLVSKSGVYLMIDSDSKEYYVFLLSSDSIKEMSLEAEDNNLGQEMCDALNNKEKAICFYDKDNTSDWPVFNKWEKYLYPVQSFRINNSEYYYSIVGKTE